ncbi:MAG: ribonuclease III [Gammaproteobacteria bacterium]|jgi:ribonuclease-3|nr:ribonuclease III [Gammaproteobacteria bacterium]
MSGFDETPAPGDLERLLGYRFRSPDLLARALTHASHGGEHNERLEFLGDAVLGLAVAETLYHGRPEATEGALTRRRARLVSSRALAAAARRLGLEQRLRVGGGFDRSTAEAPLADALEAVVAAVFLDGGWDEARRFVHRLLGPDLAAADPGADERDPKTRLQEWAQARRLPPPSYVVLARDGPSHAPRFVVRCSVGPDVPQQSAEGGSRREAEQRAAAACLHWLERS